MEEVTEIIWTKGFEQDFRKMRDRSMQDRAEKQIAKIRANPGFGKPLRHDLKGERTIYVKPYRLIYKLEGGKLILLRFEHRGKVYER